MSKLIDEVTKLKLLLVVKGFNDEELITQVEKVRELAHASENRLALLAAELKWIGDDLTYHIAYYALQFSLKSAFQHNIMLKGFLLSTALNIITPGTKWGSHPVPNGSFYVLTSTPLCSLVELTTTMEVK